MTLALGVDLALACPGAGVTGWSSRTGRLAAYAS